MKNIESWCFNGLHLLLEMEKGLQNLSKTVHVTTHHAYTYLTDRQGPEFPLHHYHELE